MWKSLSRSQKIFSFLELLLNCGLPFLDRLDLFPDGAQLFTGLGKPRSSAKDGQDGQHRQRCEFFQGRSLLSRHSTGVRHRGPLNTLIQDGLKEKRIPRASAHINIHDFDFLTRPPRDSLRGSSLASLQYPFKELARVGTGIGSHVFRPPRHQDPPPFIAARRAQVDDPVSGRDDLHVMLDLDNGVARVGRAVQDFKKLADVVEVQPGGRLVQDIQRAAGAQTEPTRLNAASQARGSLSDPTAAWIGGPVIAALLR